MTSTVLDVALCLLLVSASVGVLTAADGGGAEPADAADAADVVATSTATVEYTVEPRRPSGAAADPITVREHGTLAELLAAATTATATVDGEPLSPSADGFADAVSAAVRERLGPRVQVVAVWEPYPGASASSRVVVGPAPPPTADVRASVLSVPSGADPVDAEAAAADGYRPLVEAVAAATVDALLVDRRRHANASREAYADGRRYRFAEAVGVDPNRERYEPRLRSVLEQIVIAELLDDREATEAAGTVTVDRVRIVVRTW